MVIELFFDYNTEVKQIINQGRHKSTILIHDHVIWNGILTKNMIVVALVISSDLDWCMGIVIKLLVTSSVTTSINLEVQLHSGMTFRLILSLDIGL